MAFNHYLNRRNVVFFSSIFGLAGSYFIVKSGKLRETSQQKQAGDFRVDTSRSGGGI